jgi:hypothetical protein
MLVRFGENCIGEGKKKKRFFIFYFYEEESEYTC